MGKVEEGLDLLARDVLTPYNAYHETARTAACARLEHRRRASADSTPSSRNNRIWYLVYLVPAVF